MQTLTAIRDKQSSYNCITTLKDSNGFVKSVITGYNQPKKTQKTIKINKKMYQLNFVN